MLMRNWFENLRRPMAPVLWGLVGIVGSGCSSLPFLEDYEEPYVISRVQRPTRRTSVLQTAPERTEVKNGAVDASPENETIVAAAQAAPTVAPDTSAGSTASGASAKEPINKPIDAVAKAAPMTGAKAITSTEESERTDATDRDVPTSSHDQPTARPRIRRRLVRGDRINGVPIIESAGDFAGTVSDVLLDPTTGDVIGVVATAFGDTTQLGDAGSSARVFGFDALQWALGEIGTSLAVAGPKTKHAAHESGTAELFGSHDSSSVRGVVTDVRPSVGLSSSAILTLRDDENRLHRVLIEAADFLTRTMHGLDVGEALAVEGILTRDADGKLWIASTVSRDAQTIRLRDESGSVLWHELTAQFSSNRNVPAIIRSSDGVAIPVHGWMLDVDAGATAWICLVVNGALRILPWDDVARGPGEWTSAHDAARLGTLRRFPVGPRAVEASAVKR